jgi:hypothetical protein
MEIEKNPVFYPLISLFDVEATEWSKADLYQLPHLYNSVAYNPYLEIYNAGTHTPANILALLKKAIIKDTSIVKRLITICNNLLANAKDKDQTSQLLQPVGGHGHGHGAGERERTSSASGKSIHCLYCCSLHLNHLSV